MGDEGVPRVIENNAYANVLGDKRGVLWNSASREYAFQECTDLVTLVIEGLPAKRAYIAFLADFHFLQDQANFWQTDLC